MNRVKELKDKPLPKCKQLRLKQGAIQKAILAVMAKAQKRLSVSQIHKLVEQELKRSVSYDTVCSFLTTSAKNHKTSGIHKVRKGLYVMISIHQTQNLGN